MSTVHRYHTHLDGVKIALCGSRIEEHGTVLTKSTIVNDNVTCPKCLKKMKRLNYDGFNDEKILPYELNE